MVGEANAAIEGAFAGGATEVLVNDSHGAMFNLTPEDLDPRAVLLQGQKPWSMVAGAGRTRGSRSPCSSATTRAPAIRPARSPTPTAARRRSRRSRAGRSARAGINALALGAWGVPVGLVGGDDELALETEAWFPWAERVIVKTAVSRRAAASVHPTRRARSGACRRRAGRPPGGGGRAAAARRRPADRRSRPSTRTPARPTTRRSSRARSATAIAACGSSTDDPVIAYRAFLSGVRLAGLAA